MKGPTRSGESQRANQRLNGRNAGPHDRGMGYKRDGCLPALSRKHKLGFVFLLFGPFTLRIAVAAGRTFL